MKDLKARPTEYRGVVFASNAEARLALFLDDQKKNWWYEPESLRLDCGYVPDFMLIELMAAEDYDDVAAQKKNFGLELTLIEYKPKRPAQTYIDELAVRFKTIGDRLYSEKTLDTMLGCVVNSSMSIMVGGMGYHKAEYLSMSWCGPDSTTWIARDWRKGWGEPFEDTCPDKENKRLSSYRFDLEHSHA
jgi:hypothetical protein